MTAVPATPELLAVGETMAMVAPLTGGRLVDAAAFPFDGSRLDFRPPADWAPATLPAWWDTVPA